MAHKRRNNSFHNSYIIIIFQTLIATVNMSSLPDKGEKLRAQVEHLTSQLQDLDLKLRTKQTHTQAQGRRFLY